MRCSLFLKSDRWCCPCCDWCCTYLDVNTAKRLVASLVPLHERTHRSSNIQLVACLATTRKLKFGFSLERPNDMKIAVNFKLPHNSSSLPNSCRQEPLYLLSPNIWSKTEVGGHSEVIMAILEHISSKHMARDIIITCLRSPISLQQTDRYLFASTSFSESSPPMTPH